VPGGKTVRAIEALRDLTSPRALVIRDGQPQRIAGRDVVRGDRKLSESDRVLADAVLLSADGMRADESPLTGEAVPAGKRVARPVDVVAGNRAQTNDPTCVAELWAGIRFGANEALRTAGKSVRGHFEPAREDRRDPAAVRNW